MTVHCSTSSPARSPRRLVPAVAALSVLAAACGGGASSAPPGGVASTTTSTATVTADDTPGTDDAPGTDAIVDDGGEHLDAARRRCIVGHEALVRRIDDEGFEWPEEGPELSEEELAEVLTPEYPNVDGVASVDDRPVIEPIPVFDPETATIPELDQLIGACIEGGIVTEGELFGDDEFDDDESGDADD